MDDPQDPVQPRYVFGILSEHADALLKSLENSKTVRGRVESLLMPILHKGEANMDAIAAKMGLSRQTLFRQLKAEGTTFEKVLDELRHRLALEYLGATEGLRERNRLSRRILRTRRILPRLQALDGEKPSQHRAG